MINVLMIGDIVGNTGVKVVKELLPALIEKYDVDFVIANGENAADGNGITYEIADELFSFDIQVITMGNHVWDKKEIINFIDSEPRLIRPANYPPGTPGKGYIIYELEKGIQIGVINLAGVVFLHSLQSPFLIVDKLIKEIKEITPLIIVDFHGEATSEKVAMGYYLDGKVTGVLGTHTHIQTADERILPKGTAYITDVGMTGPRDSVLGVKKELVIKKFLTQMPIRFEVATGIGQFNGVVLKIDPSSGKAINITRIQEYY